MYTIFEAMFMARKVELIDKHTFTNNTFYKDFARIVVYITTLWVFQFAMIAYSIIISLIILSEVLIEYNKFSNIVLSDIAIGFYNNCGINDHAIKPIPCKQLF